MARVVVMLLDRQWESFKLSGLIYEVYPKKFELCWAWLLKKRVLNAAAIVAQVSVPTLVCFTGHPRPPGMPSLSGPPCRFMVQAVRIEETIVDPKHLIDGPEQ